MQARCGKLSQKSHEANYLVMFPKPQDVIRQLEIYALLSQILPWGEEVVNNRQAGGEGLIQSATHLTLQAAVLPESQRY